MLKGQKGITLVALVITIIVLLILAGVTISLTLGDRGIFNTAQKAGENYQKAADEEDKALTKLDQDIDKVVDNVLNKTK